MKLGTLDLAAEFEDARRRIYATIDIACAASKKRMREYLAREDAKAKAIAKHGDLNRRSAAMFYRHAKRRGEA